MIAGEGRLAVVTALASETDQLQLADKSRVEKYLAASRTYDFDPPCTHGVLTSLTRLLEPGPASA